MTITRRLLTAPQCKKQNPLIKITTCLTDMG